MATWSFWLELPSDSFHAKFACAKRYKIFNVTLCFFQIIETKIKNKIEITFKMSRDNGQTNSAYNNDGSGFGQVILMIIDLYSNRTIKIADFIEFFRDKCCKRSPKCREQMPLYSTVNLAMLSNRKHSLRNIQLKLNSLEHLCIIWFLVPTSHGPRIILWKIVSIG